MKKLLLLSALLIFACSSDSEGNDCIYEPTLSTEAVSEITETSATLNGVISIVSENCDIALGEMQGFAYSTNPSPTNNDNVEVVYGSDISTTIDNLTPNTTYYVRVFITNNLGEFYGNEMEFSTNDEVVSCDGIAYDSIVYGIQEWTVENACHITYRDGTPIPQVTDSDEWANLTTGAWCYYDNDPTKPILYNWYAVMGFHNSASFLDQNLRKEFAPEGWHVPSDTEWTTLEEHLIANGYNYDGSTTGNKIAKAMASTTEWDMCTSFCEGAVGNNQSLNNSSGFNALSQGFRYQTGTFGVNEGTDATFWTSTEYNIGNENQLPGSQGAWERYLFYNRSDFALGLSNCRKGFSIRFVRD